VTNGALGELMVGFDQYGWFPSRLPSDVTEDEDEQDGEHEHEDGEN